MSNKIQVKWAELVYLTEEIQITEEEYQNLTEMPNYKQEDFLKEKLDLQYNNIEDIEWRHVTE